MSQHIDSSGRIMVTTLPPEGGCYYARLICKCKTKTLKQAGKSLEAIKFWASISSQSFLLDGKWVETQFNAFGRCSDCHANIFVEILDDMTALVAECEGK